MALNVGQLLAPPTGTFVGAVKEGRGIDIASDGTISIESGGPFPNTTINYPSTIPGTADSSPWLAPNTALTAIGCIQFSVNGGPFSQGPTAVVQGNTVTTSWVVSPSCGGAPNGTVITGTLTDGTYTVSGNIQIDRVPSAFAFNDLTSQPLSSVVTSNPLIPQGFNSTAYVTLSAGATLTSVQASVNGGAYVAIPASGTTLPINPGQTLQLRGTTGAATSTAYTATINIGQGASVTSDTWRVTTTAATPSISQPSILIPANNATNVGTASGITVISSAYSPQGGAAAQASSDWQVYGNGYPITSTNTISSTVTNLTSWTPRTTGIPSSYRISGLAYGDGVFVAAAYNPFAAATPVAYQSDDGGVTWTQLTIPTITNDRLRVVYGNGSWLIWPFTRSHESGGTGCWRVGSSASTAWTTMNVGPRGPKSDTFYGAGQWVSSGGTSTGGGTEYGIVVATSGSPGGPYGYVFTASEAVGLIGQYGGGKWVYFGNYNNNLNLWVSSSFGGGGTASTVSVNQGALNQLWYGAGTFVAVGNNNLCYTSTDGSTWTTRNPQLGGNSGYTATYGNGVWVIGGTGNALSTSLDNGVTWTAQNPGFNTDGVYASAYSPEFDTFVIAGSSGKLSTAQYPAGSTTLNIAGAQTDGFAVGNSIVSSPAGAGPGTIVSLNNTQVTVIPASSSWGPGLRIAINASTYTQIVNVTGDATNLTSRAIAKPPLVANTPFYARVRYNSGGGTPVSSAWSAWSKFTTGALT